MNITFSLRRYYKYRDFFLLQCGSVFVVSYIALYCLLQEDFSLIRRFFFVDRYGSEHSGY